MQALQIYVLLKRLIQSGGATSEQIQQAVENYLQENPPSGMTPEQIQQLNQNTLAILEKLDIRQGEENSGKILSVGTDGNITLIDASSSGSDGTDGREIELQNNGTAIQWRYEGETEWQDLVQLSELKGEKGDTGEQGEAGTSGQQGEKGDPGIGIPVGGTTGQVLKKKSNTDYDTEWADGTGGSTGVATLYNKAIFIGDSTSHGWDNGYYSFVDIFDEQGDFGEVVKLAQGGATLGPYQIASIAEGKSCIEQIQNNIDEFTDADVCFLQFCLNDIKSAMAGSVQVGTADDTSETQTICGVARKIVETIYAKNPLVKIYFLNLTASENTMRYMWQLDSEASGSDTDIELAVFCHKVWNGLVMGIFEEYGIPIINIVDGINVNQLTNASYSVTSSAGAHLNTAGNTNVYHRIKASLDGNSERLYSPQPSPLIISLTEDNVTQGKAPTGTFDKIQSAHDMGMMSYLLYNDVLVWVNEIASNRAIGTMMTFSQNTPVAAKFHIGSTDNLTVTMVNLSGTPV